MRHLAAMLVVLSATAVLAQVESVYAPPEPPRPEEGVNQGGVNLNLDISYMTDYIYRGIDFSESGGAEDSPNLQFNGTLSFDLGRFPHPFVGVFMNNYNSDPVSNLQTIRPFEGAELRLRPFVFTAGNNNYIYPDRDDADTAEVFGKILLDDSYFFKTEAPVFSPYVYAAYDYDKYHGEYLEFGISHDFVIEELGIVLTPQAQVAYVNSFGLYRRSETTPNGPDPSFFVPPTGHDSGWQHYQLGLVGTYELNTLLNIPKRFGDFSVKGYLFYTDGIDNHVRSSTENWGGVGLGFSY